MCSPLTDSDLLGSVGSWCSSGGGLGASSGLSSGIVVSGIIELTIVVFGVEVISDGSGNSEEVGHVDGVGDQSP